MSQPHLFCFGLGYCALHLADALRAEGWRISGTCRDPDKLEALRARGVDAMTFDGSAPLELERLLAPGDRLLSSVPPDDGGDPVLDQHAAALRRVGPRLAWVGYLSSTGVYGDHEGAWVEETSATRPSAARGVRRLEAEQRWRALAEAGVPVHVFRLAGIYGPGRSALDAVRAGRARRIVRQGLVFSRIHVADIVAALQASLRSPTPGAIYNLADDAPAAHADVIAHACALLGREPPKAEDYAQTELSPWLRSFYADRKRVDCTRIKEALGLSWRYPDYRAGLAAILASEG